MIRALGKAKKIAESAGTQSVWIFQHNCFIFWLHWTMGNRPVEATKYMIFKTTRVDCPLAVSFFFLMEYLGSRRLQISPMS